MSSVLQHGPGKRDYPLMTLGLQGSNSLRQYRDYTGGMFLYFSRLAKDFLIGVCDILHLRSLLSYSCMIKEQAPCFTQILHQFFSHLLKVFRVGDSRDNPFLVSAMILES